MKLSEFLTNTLKLNLEQDVQPEQPNNNNNNTGGSSSGSTVEQTNIINQQQQQQKQQQQQPQQQPQQTSEEIIKTLQTQIDQLKQSNFNLLKNIPANKAPTFDECVYGIYKESRGDFDGNDSTDNSK